MKYVRWNNLIRTFRFRLTVMHVLMMSTALVITFIITMVVSRSVLAATGRNHIRASLRQACTTYLGGKMRSETKHLPEELMARVDAQLPGIFYGIVEREVQPGGFLYEIIASTGREWLEILADPDGKIWVADRKSIGEIFVLMDDAVQSDEMETMKLLVYSPTGELLAGEEKEELTPVRRDTLKRNVMESDEIQMMGQGADLFGATRLYDGNMLYAVGRLEGLERIKHWGLEFFLMVMVVFVPLSGWVGFFLSRKAMAGVKRVSEAANRVRAGNFAEQVSVGTEGAEIQALVEAFNTMVSRIDVLMRELRDVTANIAHDLKTPITRIRGMLESIGWEEVTASEREHLIANTMEECDRIMPLIDAVLELSRAEAGMLQLYKEPFDLVEEVRTAHDIFSSVAEDRSITFCCSVPEKPVPMLGDRGRMQRVIANLIDNALKFAPELGRVDVLLETTGQEAILTVCDDGPGIPADELENVFKRFYRLDPSRNKQGHGMGLSLVRAFVQVFGGSVQIDSALGKGCVIKVIIPTDTDKAASRI